MIVVEILLFFGILIFIHELGHFLVAKAVGVRIETFSLGFGPRLIGFRKGETDYRVSAVPLGGYVKMAGQFDIPDEKSMNSLTGEPWEFPSKPWWQRFLIASAGSIMNVFLAFFVFTIVAMVWGYPIYRSEVRIGIIDPAMPEFAEFQTGDVIAKAQDISLKSWDDFIDILNKSPGKPVTCEVDRHGEKLKLDLVPQLKPDTQPGKFSVRIGLKPFLKPRIGSVLEDHPASTGRLSLLPGDTITAIEETQISQWTEMREIVAKNAKKPLQFSILRSEPFTLKLLTKTESTQLGDYGIVVDQNLDISSVEEKSPGYVAGFLAGDRILESHLTKVPGWKKLLYRISGKSVQNVVEARVSREHPFVTTIEPMANPFNGEGYIGITNDSSATFIEIGREKIGIGTALLTGAESTIVYSQMIFTTVKKLISRDVSMDNLAGPVRITRMIGQQAKSGLNNLLEFLAILSVNLGIINFFPIPVLDGGMMVVLLVEGIRRKPLPLRIQVILQQIGLLLLVPLILYVTYNDVIQVIGKVLAP